MESLQRGIISSFYHLSFLRKDELWFLKGFATDFLVLSVDLWNGKRNSFFCNRSFGEWRDKRFSTDCAESENKRGKKNIPSVSERSSDFFLFTPGLPFPRVDSHPRWEVNLILRDKFSSRPSFCVAARFLTLILLNARLPRSTEMTIDHFSTRQTLDFYKLVRDPPLNEKSKYISVWGTVTFYSQS